MKRLEIMQQFSPEAVIATSLFQEPLTESDILTLQDKFLTNGFQHIQLKDIATGRLLMKTFLASMHMYNSISCLTLEKELPKNVSDIFHDLSTYRYDKNNIEQFFIDNFYYDFLWIEATADLLKKDWYNHFERSIIDYKIDQQIPIIVISYQE